jgi:hypothetical protein
MNLFRHKLKLKQRPKIKCDFCGLKFHLDNERKEHDVTWHTDGIVNE